MMHVQSGLTAPSAGTASRFTSNSRSPAESSETMITRAASLLLGLHLRGWLTNREKDYLDNLAPDNAITFLVRGDAYLHPADLPLFPMDVVHAAADQAGDASFSRRYDDPTGSGRSSRIFTGLIGNSSGNPLVLGMFGPDDPFNHELLANRFGVVLSSFRTADTDPHRVIEALPSLPAGAARIIVNRTSGRVVHADEAIAERLGVDLNSLTSREYNEVSPLVARLVKAHRLKLENLAGERLQLALMTFLPMAARTGSGSAEPDALVDSIRDDLSTITSSAGFIEDHAGSLETTELSNLAAQIVMAGERLDRRLARHQLLANFDHREEIEVNVIYQLEEAIDRITALGGRGISVVVPTGHDDLVRRAPADAWLLLFESVLETHRFARGEVGNTTVRISRDPDEQTARISFTTVLPPAMRLADLERVWYQDTEALAARLSVAVNKNLVLESNTIVTRLTLSPQEGIVA